MTANNKFAKMKSKWQLLLILIFVTLIFFGVLIFFLDKRRSAKSNPNNAPEEIALFDIYYSGSQNSPEEVIMIEEGNGGMFCFWNFGEGWSHSSPYTGSFIKFKSQIYLHFPTYDCRGNNISESEIDLPVLRYRLNSRELIPYEYIINFKKLAAIRHLKSKLNDSNGDQQLELPMYLQKVFTEMSRSASGPNKH